MTLLPALLPNSSPATSKPTSIKDRQEAAILKNTILLYITSMIFQESRREAAFNDLREATHEVLQEGLYS